MNGTTSGRVQHHRGRETTLKRVASGLRMEAIGAIATIVLSTVGLAGLLSATLAAIATSVMGAAILLEGGAMDSAEFTSRTGVEKRALSRGMSAEFLGGPAGIILGMLAVLGVAPLTLLSVAVTVYGASFLLAPLAMAQANCLSGFRHTQAAAAAGQVAPFSFSSQVVVGLAAVVLGILAIIGLSALTLTLVGLLSLGVGALLSGPTFSFRALWAPPGCKAARRGAGGQP